MRESGVEGEVESLGDWKDGGTLDNSREIRKRGKFWGKYMSSAWDIMSLKCL